MCSTVAGYVVAEVLDGNAHVAQVSVAPSYAGRGIGRELMEHEATLPGLDASPRCAMLKPN